MKQEERELTDAEFEQGLKAVLGTHYQDLTVCRPTRTPERKRERGWETVCWLLIYGCLAALLFRQA